MRSRLVLTCFSFSLLACEAQLVPGPGLDGSLDGGSGVCADDDACDDGVYCNGIERCAPGDPGADALGCAPSGTGSPCALGERCVELERECRASCAVEEDADGDGALAPECGGDDCDDHDSRRFPSAPEQCDATSVDEDCDPATVGTRDSDRDGWVDALCCNGLECGQDCDDARVNVNPDAPEGCNGIDDDCDAFVDEGVLITFYRDIDGDNAGQTGGTIQACSAPLGYVFMGGDCNDTNRSINPSATDTCNEVDDNCDGEIDPMHCECTDGVEIPCGESDGVGGFLDRGECRSGVIACVRGMRQACTATFAREESSEACNGRDEDCDGAADDGIDVGCYVDADNDTFAPAGALVQRLFPSLDAAREPFGFCPFGYTSRAPTATLFDCADTSSTIRPGATEVCNGLDDDCNRAVDDGPGAPRTCYRDEDGDGYAAGTSGASSACTCPARTTTRVPAAGSTDCDDTLASVSPVGVESCDPTMRDEDCDSVANEGCDCVPPATRFCPSPGACAMGTQMCMVSGAGSSWGMCSVSPTAETCNGVDDNCDGSTDETFACARGSAALGCTTACGTAGASACLSGCSRDVCRAAEICNFCDDDGDGSDDRGVAGSTQTLRASGCSSLRLTGDATRTGSCDGSFARLTTADSPSQYGTARLNGTVRVGWGPVRFFATMSEADAVLDGIQARDSYLVQLGTWRRVGLFERFYGIELRWTFSPGGSETDRLDISATRSDGTAATLTHQSQSGTFPNFNTDQIAHNTTIEILYNPVQAGGTHTVSVRFGGGTYTRTWVVDGATLFPPNTAVTGAVSGDTDGGVAQLSLWFSSGVGLEVTAANTCPM